MRRGLSTLSIFATGLLLGFRQVWSPDLWWQLAEARWILEHRTFPAADSLTYGMAGIPYIAHEWASGMVFYGLYRAFGAHGLQLFVSLSFGLLGVLFFRMLRSQGAGELGAWVCSLVFLFLARVRFPLRPELFSNIFMLLVIALGMRPADKRALSGYFLLFALWANFHGEFALGLAYVFLCLEWRRLLAASLGVLCNPYGWKVLSVPATYFIWHRSIFAISTEGHRHAQTFNISLLLMAGALGLLLLNWRRKRGAPLPWRELLLVSAFGLETLRSTRILVIFLVVALPILYRQAVLYAKSRPWAQARVPLLALALPIVFCLLRFPLAQAWAHPMDQRSLPEKAVDFMEGISASGKVYNSFAFGGYLEWRLYPKIQPFYDGRYIAVGLEQEENKARESPAQWASFIQRYDADFACLDWVWEGGLNNLLWPAWGEGWREQGSRSPYDYLFPRDRWALIYWDDRALVFVRRLPKYRALIRRYELLYTEPLEWEHTLELMRRGKVQRAKVLKELSLVETRSGRNWVLDRMLTSMLRT